MATKIRPLHDRVIVKRIEEEEKTRRTDYPKYKPREGEIVAVGPGKEEDGKVIMLKRETRYSSLNTPVLK